MVEAVFPNAGELGSLYSCIIISCSHLIILIIEGQWCITFVFALLMDFFHFKPPCPVNSSIIIPSSSSSSLFSLLEKWVVVVLHHTLAWLESCFILFLLLEYFVFNGVAGVVVVMGMSSLSSNFHFFFATAVVKVFFDCSFLGDSNFANSFFH